MAKGNKEAAKAVKMKIRRGDKVKIIAGKDKGREGKVLLCDKKSNRVIVEGVNMVSKHVKAGRRRDAQQGGIIRKEAPIHASNVMFVYKGKPVRLGAAVTVSEAEGKKTVTKQRVARPSGETID